MLCFQPSCWLETLSVTDFWLLQGQGWISRQPHQTCPRRAHWHDPVPVRRPGLRHIVRQPPGTSKAPQVARPGKLAAPLPGLFLALCHPGTTEYPLEGAAPCPVPLPVPPLQQGISHPLRPLWPHPKVSGGSWNLTLSMRLCFSLITIELLQAWY